MHHELTQIATKLAQGLPVVLPAGWRFTPLLHEQEHQIPTVSDQPKAEDRLDLSEAGPSAVPQGAKILGDHVAQLAVLSV